MPTERPGRVASFLIVTADDFGLHESVNEAVERASRVGVLTAASLTVAAPASADAVRRARAIPDLRVGLHLVLADGWAKLAPGLIPDLTDTKGPMDDRMFARGVRFFAVPSVRRQLEAEIRAQFSAFAQTGLLLDHVNVHKHFHLHPTLLDMLVRIGADFDLCAVRLPKEPLWFSQRYAGWLAGPARAALLRPWLAVMKHRLDAAGLIYNDQIFGIAASGAMDEATLLEILARLPSGATEIYLHPATHSGAAIAPSLDGYRHAAEFAGLLSTRVKAALDAIDARRGGYRDLHVRRERLSC